MEMTKKKEEQIVQFVIDLCLRVGKRTLAHQRKLESLKIETKDKAGIASNADIEAEELIFKALKKEYPEFDFLGEEQAYFRFGDKREAYNYFRELDYCFVVDPIDGTNNFVNGLDYYAISIALVKRGEPYLGVVYRPRNGDCFYAIKDRYSKFKNFEKNSRAINLFEKNNNKKLCDSMLASNFCKRYRPDQFDQEIERLIKLIHETRSLRRFGSAALDMCYVALGTIDGYWEKSLSPWDTAASGLICQQAGVKVTDFLGKRFSPFEGSILAARSPLYSRLKKFF